MSPEIDGCRLGHEADVPDHLSPSRINGRRAGVVLRPDEGVRSLGGTASARPAAPRFSRLAGLTISRDDSRQTWSRNRGSATLALGGQGTDHCACWAPAKLKTSMSV
jgi:hypothetical protein